MSAKQHIPNWLTAGRLVLGFVMFVCLAGAAGAIILFREFFVSALREVGAGRNVVFPVTQLAKWKTTIQLVALGAQLIVASWPAWGLQSDPAVLNPAILLANTLMWVAAA